MGEKPFHGQDVGEILETVTDKLPKMISALLSTVYSEETATNLGKAVGAFYKQLREAGFSNEDAIKMTHDYLKSISNIKSMMEH